MTRRKALVFALTVLFAGCASAPPERVSLQGTWAPQEAQLGGQNLPVAAFAGGKLHLSETEYEFAGDKGSYRQLAGTTPAAMDIQGREGPNAGRTIAAIYALQGQRLTICYQLGKGERPDTFLSPKGSKVLLVSYQREP